MQKLYWQVRILFGQGQELFWQVQIFFSGTGTKICLAGGKIDLTDGKIIFVSLGKFQTFTLLRFSILLCENCGQFHSHDHGYGQSQWV